MLLIQNHTKYYNRLSSKHTAHAVAKSPEPIYRHGNACLSKQPSWYAAGDSPLAHGRYQVRAPAGMLHTIFFSTLPSFPLGEIVYFASSPPPL